MAISIAEYHDLVIKSGTIVKKKERAIMNQIKQDDQVVGIDIGGSHITAGFVDVKTGEIIQNRIMRKQVNSHAAAEEILDGWCAVIKELWADNKVKSSRLGFAMPGPFDYFNGISLITGFDKYEALYELNIREELAERLDLPGDDICFRNDAAAFMEGELLYGAAKGYTHAIGITLGTGLGSSSSHYGVTRDAELSVLPYKGERIEDYVSTRGLIRAYREASGTTAMNAKTIADRYSTDKHARTAFDTFSNDLAWFLEYFIREEEPEVLVIGGNIAHSWPLYENKLVKTLTAAVPAMPAIKMAALGEHAALIGGASCF
jgi:glucokinase